MSFIERFFTNSNSVPAPAPVTFFVEREGPSAVCPAGGYKIDTPGYQINICSRSSRSPTPADEYDVDTDTDDESPLPLPSQDEKLPPALDGNGDNVAGRPRWSRHGDRFFRDGRDWSWENYSRRYGSRHRNTRYWRRGRESGYWYWNGSSYHRRGY